MARLVLYTSKMDSSPLANAENKRCTALSIVIMQLRIARVCNTTVFSPLRKESMCICHSAMDLHIGARDWMGATSRVLTGHNLFWSKFWDHPLHHQLFTILHESLISLERLQFLEEFIFSGCLLNCRISVTGPHFWAAETITENQQMRWIGTFMRKSLNADHGCRACWAQSWEFHVYCCAARLWRLMDPDVNILVPILL